MSDIVHRLRHFSKNPSEYNYIAFEYISELTSRAADEIERLTDELREARSAVTNSVLESLKLSNETGDRS